MNKKIALSAIMVAVITIASIQMALFAVGNEVNPLGLEIAGKADEVLTGHQTDIENFITEKQVIIAETQEERLGIIENKKNELTTAIEEANETRQQLIADFEAGTKDEEEFVAGMKSLATDISSAADSMGELGELLGGLEQELPEGLKARAQSLSEEIRQAESEVSALGTTDSVPTGLPEEISPELSEGTTDSVPTGLPEEISPELSEGTTDSVPMGLP